MHHLLKRYYSGVPVLLAMMSFSASTHKPMNPGIKQEDPAITLEVYHQRIANTNQAVLVYFSAGWCAVCPKFKPVIAEIEKEYSGKLEILRIDTERDVEVAREYEVNTLPLLVLYKNGKKVWISSGIIPITSIRREIDCYL